MIFHYTYRITNTIENKHYYGVRSSQCLPENDLGVTYLSSSSDKNFIKEQKINPGNFRYKIIRISSTREKALLLEIKLHEKFNVKINESFYNRAKQTSVNCCTQGRKFPYKKRTPEQIEKYRRTRRLNQRGI